jgi:CheY-like chemotaxis protein
MTIRLLIADPDITFAIGIKRALEQTGDFAVTAFGTGDAALELLQTASYDAVLLDMQLSDTEIGRLIISIRAVQPDIAIFVSPRTTSQIQGLGAWKVQGSIPKPYYARQLAPLILNSLNRKLQQSEQVADANAAPEPDLPLPSVSPDFDAAIASLPSLIVEPPVSPDDTFRRHLATMLPEKPATPAGLKKTLESVDLSGSTLSDDATIADVVQGKPLTDPAETRADSEMDRPTIAEVALDALDTLPTGRFSMDQLAEQVEQTTGMPLPDWVQQPAPDNAATDPIAQVATAFTQLSTGTTTRAILLTRDEELIAAAGELRGDDAVRAAILIENAWQKGDNKGNTLLCYLSVPGFGDFLLYSTDTIDGMRLSMFFPAETTMRAVRRHARQLLDALVKSDAAAIPPDMIAPDQGGGKQTSDETLPARPTQPRPPVGLKDALDDKSIESPLTIEKIDEKRKTGTQAEAVPLTAFSVLWSPRDGIFDPEIQPMLSLWLTEACLEQHYLIESAQTQPGFLTFQLQIPTTEAPNAAISRLMEATAARAGNPELWTDGYYIATPARPISQQEITAFLGAPRE